MHNRPSCLLNGLAKVFDKLLTQRLQHQIYRQSKMGGNQYGITKVIQNFPDSIKMALTKINQYKQVVNKLRNSYIKSSFNNFWLTDVLEVLGNSTCPEKLFHVTNI